MASTPSALAPNAAAAPAAPPPSTLFILRVWPQAGGPRISVRAAADALPTLFEQTDGLLDYLVRRSAEAEPAAAPPGSGDGSLTEPANPDVSNPKE